MGRVGARVGFAHADREVALALGDLRQDGLALLLAGILGAELFLTRISIVGTLMGVVLFQFGWERLRMLAFPLLFLLLMIPLPWGLVDG